MAVQAQYPSNILLFNRNVQDGNNDYSLHPQPGGLYIDQSHMLFNNGGSANTRKRGREVNSTTDNNNYNNNNNNNNNNTSSSINMYPSMQSRPPQLIDLALLHNTQSNNNGVSTGLRLSFGDQQKQHQHQQQHHHHHQHFLQQTNNNIYHPSSNSTLPSVLSEDFDAQIKQQREEIEQLLHAQAEQLRRTLAEKRQRHYRALLGVANEFLTRTLREKEAEVEKATRKNAELQARAAQLNAEVQVWQAKARAQEATVASLQAQIQQALIYGQDSGSGLDRALGPEGQAEDAESVYIDPDRVVEVEPSCKTCQKRTAAVVALPCRHLCLCMVCDQVVQSCPVCLCLKSSSVEVYFS